MMKPLIIKAIMGSPICGDPPAMDALLEWQLGLLMGMVHKITRDHSIKEEEFIPIPISKHRINDGKFYWGVSNPICSRTNSTHVEYANKHFESGKACLIASEHRKNILTSSGPYKSRHAPLTVYRIDEIVWFCHGDRREIKKLLKNIRALGKKRSIGFGNVNDWIIEEIEKDNSIIAGSDRVLMKTVPREEAIRLKATAFQISYGGFRPPYWHPDNYTEIAIPC